MENRQEIEILLSNLKKRLQGNKTELAASPSGCLHQIHYGKKTSYQHAIRRPDGTCSRKVITQEPELVKQLARKEYLRKESDVLEKDITILEQLLRRYVDPGARTILQMLPRRFQNLPEDWFW